MTAATPRPTFPAEARVLAGGDFRRVRAARQSVRDGVLEIAWRANGRGITRLGLAVPVKGYGAVGRNRVRRLVREVFRVRRARLPAGFDLVVVPRDRVLTLQLAPVAAAFDSLIARILHRLVPA